MTKFVSLCRMAELSICDSFLDPCHNCGGHDAQHLHGGQHRGHPHDQVCVTLQDGGVLRVLQDGGVTSFILKLKAFQFSGGH